MEKFQKLGRQKLDITVRKLVRNMEDTFAIILKIELCAVAIPFS